MSFSTVVQYSIDDYLKNKISNCKKMSFCIGLDKTVKVMGDLFYIFLWLLCNSPQWEIYPYCIAILLLRLKHFFLRLFSTLSNIPLCIILPSTAPLQGQKLADNCIFDPLSDCPRVALFESQVALAGSGDAGRLDRHLHLLLPRPRQLLHRLLHIRCLRHGAIPQVKD